MVIRKLKLPCMVEFVKPVFEKQRQEDWCEFEASQGYIIKPCLKKHPLFPPVKVMGTTGPVTPNTGSTWCWNHSVGWVPVSWGSANQWSAPYSGCIPIHAVLCSIIWPHAYQVLRCHWHSGGTEVFIVCRLHAGHCTYQELMCWLSYPGKTESIIFHAMRAG